MKKEFLINISYSDYVPGMKLYLHQDHEGLKKSSIVEIKEISGFDKTSWIFKFPWSKDLYFITAEGVKIVWGKVDISCYVECDQTTSFLEEMVERYELEAQRRLNDHDNYSWSIRDYEDYLEDKQETLLEVIIEYEHKKAKEMQLKESTSA